MTHLIPAAPPASRASEHDLLLTLFDLAHQVTSVLDQDELFQKIQRAARPRHPVRRVRRLSARQEARRAAHRVSVRLPAGVAETVRLKVGEGVVGTAIAEQRPMVINDVQSDPRYKNLVPGMNSALVVPLIYKTQVIGALNILSHQRDTFDESDIPLLGQFAALRRGRAGELAAVRARAPRTARRSKRSRRSAAARGDSRSRRAAHAHGAADQAGDRLPHVRHLAAQRDERRWSSSSPCTSARPCRRRG